MARQQHRCLICERGLADAGWLETYTFPGAGRVTICLECQKPLSELMRVRKEEMQARAEAVPS